MSKAEEQFVTLQMQGDFAGKLAASRPIQAVAELIWNGLDAEARLVKVTAEIGELRLQSITIQDDGHGMSRQEALRYFENLGGSWKKMNNVSKGGLRHLHGKEGRGRLRALAIGRVAEWTVTGKNDAGKLETFTVTIIRDDLRRAQISQALETDQRARTGTRVRITELDKDWHLDTDSAYQEIAESFALYMTEYRDVSIVFDGRSLNPSAAIRQRSTYTLPEIEADDGQFPASIEVVEWKRQTDRMLYLCDEDGLPLQRVPPMIQAPGFEFSAYHKSAYNSRLNQRGALDVAEFDAALSKSIEDSKEVLRKHFKLRQAEDTRSLVERWKTEAVYPYKEEPSSLIETAERQLFDILALNVSSALQTFEDQDSKNKRFQLRMLRQAIEKSPEEVQLIMTEVLGLSRQKQDELAKLLRRTTLSSIIAAGKMVSERLDFLTGLEAMLFDPDLKRNFKERKQLHKLLADNTWIFGEQFNLAVSDRSLSEVVRKHLVSIGAKAEVDTNLKRLDGRTGIIDLFLTRRIPTSRAEEREYLIVELKAPRVDIGSKETSQLRSYAYPIQDDERFRNMKIRWEFWVISNDMTPAVVKEVTSSDRPFGMLDRKDNCQLWVKTWAEILTESRARLQLFEKELNCNVDKDGGLAYLRSAYARILSADDGLSEADDDADEKDESEGEPAA